MTVRCLCASPFTRNDETGEIEYTCSKKARVKGALRMCEYAESKQPECQFYESELELLEIQGGSFIYAAAALVSGLPVRRKRWAYGLFFVSKGGKIVSSLGDSDQIEFGIDDLFANDWEILSDCNQCDLCTRWVWGKGYDCKRKQPEALGNGGYHRCRLFVPREVDCHIYPTHDSTAVLRALRKVDDG